MTRAILISARIGALALAIHLQSAGIEARDRPGGRACVFEKAASCSMPAPP